MTFHCLFESVNAGTAAHLFGQRSAFYFPGGHHPGRMGGHPLTRKWQISRCPRFTEGENSGNACRDHKIVDVTMEHAACLRQEPPAGMLDRTVLAEIRVPGKSVVHSSGQPCPAKIDIIV